MKFHTLFLCLLIWFPQFLSPLKETSETLWERNPHSQYLVIWNTGNSSWITLINSDSCLHFDPGGQRFPNEIEICRGKNNLLYLSHWDQSHFHWIPKLRRHLGNLCLAQGPLYKKHPKKMFYLPKVEACPKAPNNSYVKNLIPMGSRTKSENHNSRIWLLLDRYLVLNDAPKKTELKIVHNLKLSSIEGVILSNNGSPSGNSRELFSALPNLKWVALEKARVSGEVLSRIYKLKKPAQLSTKDWGHLWLKIDI